MVCLPPANATVTIDRPIDQVFEFLADGVNAPRWMSWVIESKAVGYGGGVGATYSQKMVTSLLGHKWLVYRIVHYHSPITLGIEASSLPGRPTVRFHLSSTDSASTTITVHTEVPDGGAAASSSAGRRWVNHIVESLAQITPALEVDQQGLGAV